MRRLPASRLLATASVLFVAACSGRYQAPVDEQGQVAEIRRPIIVSSSSSSRDDRSSNQPEIRDVSSGSSSRALPSLPSLPAVGSAVNAVRNVAQLAATTHRVQSGDTLYSIAFQYDVDFRELALVNNLRPPYTIFVDQVLNLRGGAAGSAPSVSNSNLGVAVGNSSTARASGTNTTGGVIRSTIGGGNIEPAWQWPLSGPVTRGFDVPGNKGIDIAAAQGDTVRAAADGQVVYAGQGVQGTGNLVILRHGDRYLSAYAHNRVMLVEEGMSVRSGDAIAEVGSSPTGEALLHFEIRQDGKPVDPQGVLPR